MEWRGAQVAAHSRTCTIVVGVSHDDAPVAVDGNADMRLVELPVVA